MKKNRGQSMLEYAMLLLLITTVFYGVYKKVSEKNRAGELFGGVLASPFNQLESDNPRAKYRRFKILR